MSAQELPVHTNGPQPRQQVEVAIALIVQFPIPLTSKLLMFTNVTMGCLNGLESKLLHLSNINIRPAAFPPANKITLYSSSFSDTIPTIALLSEPLVMAVCSIESKAWGVVQEEKRRDFYLLWNPRQLQRFAYRGMLLDSLLVHVARGQSTYTLYFLSYHSRVRGL